MEYLVTSKEMKDWDAHTITKIGMPSMVLMERAALAAEEELYKGFNLNRVLIVCGSGNNGGDGFALARLLHLKKYDVNVLFAGDESKLTDETKNQIAIAESYGVKISKDYDFSGFTTIIDGLFGIGLKRPIDGEYAKIINQINLYKGDVLALDIPSGLSADTGEVMGVCVKATKTVAFGYKKIGHVLYPGAEYSGEVIVKDIGITMSGQENNKPACFSYDTSDLSLLPERKLYSNKGTYGKVLVIAGSPGMGGAAYFAAKAAYKTGAGLVKIFTAQENRVSLQTMLPEAILSAFSKDNINFEELTESISWASSIVIGPGLGTSLASKEILKLVLSTAKAPVVADADAINIISQQKDMLALIKGEVIITPHLGEMSRLIKKPVLEISENLISQAADFSQENNVVCVLKDARTIVAKTGESVYINQSGNNGMATGGSGDVLAGIIGGLLAQGIGAFEGACLGVYIHGLAGEAASNIKGLHSVMAGDIAEGISSALLIGKFLNKQSAKNFY